MVINDQDKLLISFGDEADATLQQQYKAIPSTAHRYDVTKDPSTCSGHDDTTMRQRMKHLF